MISMALYNNAGNSVESDGRIACMIFVRKSGCLFVLVVVKRSCCVKHGEAPVYLQAVVRCRKTGAVGLFALELLAERMPDFGASCREGVRRIRATW